MPSIQIDAACPPCAGVNVLEQKYESKKKRKKMKREEMARMGM